MHVFLIEATYIVQHSSFVNELRLTAVRVCDTMSWRRLAVSAIDQVALKLAHALHLAHNHGRVPNTQSRGGCAVEVRVPPCPSSGYPRPHIYKLHAPRARLLW